MKGFRHKSLTKNWPGGRRHAAVIGAVMFEGSAPLWNTVIAAFKKPYLPAAEEKKADMESGSPVVEVSHGAPPGTVVEL